MAPMPAAIQAARELGSPIIAMTVVLAAVYVPIGFQGGLTGALFSEFAFALIGAVTISGIVALTLSPMLCSRLLKLPDPEHGGWEARLTGFIDRQFHRLRGGYERWLHGSLNTLAVTLVFAAIVLVSNHFLVPQRHERAGADRRPGRPDHVVDCGAELDAAAARALFAADLRRLRVASGNRARLPARRARPVARRHGVQAMGPAQQDDQSAAAGGAAGGGQRSRACGRRCFSRRRCPAPSACRCSSCS